MSYLEIENLSHSFGDNVLFRNAGLILNPGEHLGIVGQNGAGKSTLIRFCTGQAVPDEGTIRWQPGIALGYLDQYAKADGNITLEEFLRSAFSELFELEREMNGCYRRAAEGEEGALEQAAALQEQLEAAEFYGLETKIDRMLTGLGLHDLGRSRPLSAMSGGQRAKVILAKLLLEQPDVLLLDEPTNFLDKEQILWLAGYLSELPNAFLVVTHDFGFLEKAVNGICDLDEGKIVKYRGTYSQFLRKRDAAREEYLRRYTAQQREIKRTEEFIRRNLAGSRTKMAQSRRTQLSHLERLEAPELHENRPVFHFTAAKPGFSCPLEVEDLSVGYDAPLLPGLSFSLGSRDKVVLSGFNGVGKTTLLKTLMGELPPLGGAFRFGSGTVTGYFEQDFSWEDPKLTPLELLDRLSAGETQRELRRRLAASGISAKHAAQPLETLSGGEQAKVKLCILTRQTANLLILDEPTNHLDQNAKAALQTAIREFPGAVLLVTHEEAFYSSWADRVIPIGKSAE